MQEWKALVHLFTVNHHKPETLACYVQAVAWVGAHSLQYSKHNGMNTLVTRKKTRLLVFILGHPKQRLNIACQFSWLVINATTSVGAWKGCYEASVHSPGLLVLVFINILLCASQGDSQTYHKAIKTVLKTVPITPQLMKVSSSWKKPVEAKKCILLFPESRVRGHLPYLNRDAVLQTEGSHSESPVPGYYGGDFWYFSVTAHLYLFPASWSCGSRFWALKSLAGNMIEHGKHKSVLISE